MITPLRVCPTWDPNPLGTTMSNCRRLLDLIAEKWGEHAEAEQRLTAINRTLTRKRPPQLVAAPPNRTTKEWQDYVDNVYRRRMAIATRIGMDWTPQTTIKDEATVSGATTIKDVEWLVSRGILEAKSVKTKGGNRVFLRSTGKANNNNQ